MPTFAQTIRIHDPGRAKSWDPAEHDLLGEMIVFKNVNPRLISLAKSQKIQGVASSHWTISRDSKEWTFFINNKIKFSDGTQLTPEIVGTNLKRILWLSRFAPLAITDWFGKCLNNWDSMEKPIKCVAWTNDELVLTFEKVPNGLLELLEQSIWGIIPLKYFDQKTGKFNMGPYPSAGPYKIETISETKCELVKNWITPELPERLHFDWNTIDITVKETYLFYDVIVATSTDSNFLNIHKIIPTNWKVSDGILSTMRFVQLNDKKGIFKNKIERQRFQDIFWSKLNISTLKKELALSNSFLPKGALGYAESKNFLFTKKVLKHTKPRKVKFLWWPPSQIPEISKELLRVILESLKLMDIDADVVEYKERSELVKAAFRGDFDILVRQTGVLPHNPIADLKMMFMTKLGSQIPDPSGRVAKILQKIIKNGDNKNVQQVKSINEVVFDDAAIVTFMHEALNYVYNGNKIDFSQNNALVDPFDILGTVLVQQ